MRLHCKFISKFPSLHCVAMYMAVIFMFFITNSQAQTTPVTDSSSKNGVKINPNGNINDTSGKTTKINSNDTTAIKDTIKSGIATDSVSKTGKTAESDTSKRKKLEATLGIRISKDALASVVKAEAQDSAVMDMQSSQSHLYGKTQVNYEDLQVNAGQISYNQKSNMVAAGPSAEIPLDSTALRRGSFTQGKEKITYDSLLYNFKSKRAIIRNAQTQYGEGFMHSAQIKRNPDQVIFGSHSIYTTCALDTPHFGIVATRIKVVPNKIIVSGPANIYIEGVPTPLFLPFAIFPISDKQKSGFVIPTYTIEDARGLGLLNGGYYFYLNDHADLLTQANIYTKGSYALNLISNYNSIYEYKGGLNLSYALNKTGEDFEPGASITKDFMINWRHASDAKAIPGVSFNASVQLGSSTYYSNNSYDPNQILQSQRSSNISFSKTWQGLPLGLTVSALGSQNTLTKATNITLPAINFHVTQFNPFAKKTSIGTHWYDKITSSYTMDMLNKTTFYDSTFSASNLGLRNFQTGMHHTIPVSASYTIFRYVNMSFSVNYDEYWLTNQLYQSYNNVEQKIDSVNKYGFYTARDFNAGVNFTTRIYGMKMFKHGKIHGIRHVVTPTLGVSYHPDFGASPYNYYYKTKIDSTGDYTLLSPYVTSIVGTPPLGKAGLINMGIGNNLQIKVKSSKDTVTGYKNVTLIDGFSINTSYNVAVDSFNWSPIAVSFRTNVLDKLNITSSATFDPYALDYNTGLRLQEFNEDLGRGFARFTAANISLGANFHSKPVGGTTSPTNSEEYARVMKNAGYKDYVDFNIPWSFNFSYTMTAANNYSPYSKSDTLVISHNITLQGEFQLTKRWKLSVNTGYNFTFNALTLTSIDVYRDLHCWAMHFQAFPFGPRKSYNFTLNVKATVLQDLKIMKRRDYRDTPF